MKIAMLGVKSIPCAGGIATYTLQLGTRLLDLGHDVTVYCRRSYLEDPSERKPDAYRGIERRLTPGISGKYLDAITHTFTSALDVLQSDYDLVHLHGSAPGVVLPLLRLRSDLPIVTTIHSLDWEGAKWGRAATAAMRLAAGVPVHYSDRVTVVSERLQRFYAESFGIETVYIPSGVEMPQLRGAEEIGRRWGLEEGSYALFVGRLTPEKNLELLMDAWGRLNTSLRLVIVGGIKQTDAYAQRIIGLAPENVLFTDYQTGDTLGELYSNAHLYIQPSSLEGISMSVLEALSYGRCVVASDIPGNTEALGSCGYAFESGNADSLTGILRQLIDDEALVREQFEPARQHVRRSHNWDTTAGQFDQLFRQLCERRDHSPERSSAGLVAGGEQITPSK